MIAVVVAVCAFVVAAGMVLVINNLTGVRAQRAMKSRVARLRGQAGKPQVAADLRQQMTPRMDQAPLLSSVLRQTSLWEELQLEILRAGLLLRPSELVAFMALSALAGVGLGLVAFKKLSFGILLGCAGGVLPWVWLKVRQGRRMRALANQLPDAIDMLSSALRSGFSFLRGVQTVAGQMQPPIADEFRRLAAEVQMGMATDEALDNLVERTRCYDLELLVAAVQIQLETGGNLAEVLDNIALTIRERIRLQGEINAATAEVRLSAAILFAMPVLIGMAVNFLNPGYLTPLIKTPVGLAMLLVAAVLMSIGAIIIRKMLDVDM